MSVMKTTRGYHFIFKSETPMKNSLKTRCAIGLYYDVKSWGKLTYTVIKKTVSLESGYVHQRLKKCPTYRYGSNLLY